MRMRASQIQLLIITYNMTTGQGFKTTRERWVQMGGQKQGLGLQFKCTVCPKSITSVLGLLAETNCRC
jgi:hypothetical protein